MYYNFKIRTPCFATLKLFINQRRRKSIRLRPHYIKPWGTKNSKKKKKKTNKQTNIITIGYIELEF
jgi:hypothetical protein